VACNHCGPTYLLLREGKSIDKIEEILVHLLRILRDGGVVAMKGTGGFHLVCSAFSEDGVKKLRALKHRDGKPFALMFRDPDQARQFVEIGPEEEKELTSWRRPIVLLQKKRQITKGIADGLSGLGIMLPYMPFHHLLFEKGDLSALVMTSGNFSQEPILISDRMVKEQFGPQVDGVVTYNRDIFNRVDDSVSSVIGSKPMVLRRARGYTPTPIRTHLDLEGILGTGAELTGSFCMGKGHLALMSQYTGDLKNLPSYEFYREIYERYCRLFRFTPQLVVSDLHPDYLSSRFALELTQNNPGVKHISVQHHHAHIASAMLDAGVDGDVLGFGFDGSGYGTDGRMWGAEVQRASYEDFDRLFHFEYVNLPGGDKASQEPWRMGVSYLYKCFGEDMYGLSTPLTRHFSRKDMQNMQSLMDKKINSPFASSAGRLFDAVAAILGLNYYSSYQAEAPMLLESAIDRSEEGRYPFSLEGEQISFTSLIKEVVEDVHRGIAVGRIAAKFHHSLVHLILQISMEYRVRTGMDRVVLSGGTFQNRYLCGKLMEKLEKEKFHVLVPGRIPPNDQGIAMGQLAIGAHRKKLL
jgi:hydrogenase maturation protein HypF